MNPLRDTADAIRGLVALPQVLRRLGELEVELGQVDERLAAFDDRQAEQDRRIGDVHAVSHELYVSGDELAALDQAEGQLCDVCRQNPGRPICADPACITRQMLGRRHA